MTDRPGTPEREPDWTIDLSHPIRPVQTDARLPAVRETILAAQTQLLAIVETMAAVEDVIRDCAANGMTRDEITDQCAVSIEAVDRVIAGGTLFNFPS